MATGKERGFKDWKGSKEFRRSARNYTESDVIKGHPKRKGNRKWCKGKVGRKHILALYNKYTWSTSHKCVKCGKEIWGAIKREDFDYVPMRWEDFH
jgi:hypothetical protein